VGEVCALRWRSVDTAHQRLVIEEAKTAAGIREIGLSLDLVEELNAWRAERKPASVDEFVFATASSRPRDKDSVRERVFAPVVNRANEIRAECGLTPLPKVTPHALRRTYISLKLEAGARCVCDGPGRPRGLQDDARDLRAGAEARLAQERARRVRPAAYRRGHRRREKPLVNPRLGRLTGVAPRSYTYT